MNRKQPSAFSRMDDFSTNRNLFVANILKYYSQLFFCEHVKSVDNLWKSVRCFHHVGYQDQIQIMSDLTGPNYLETFIVHRPAIKLICGYVNVLFNTLLKKA